MKILLDLPEDTVTKFESLSKTDKRSRKACMELALIEYNPHKVENPISERNTQGKGQVAYTPPIETKKTVVEWIEEKREINLPEQYQEFIDRLNKVKYLTDKQKSEIKYA